MQKYLKYGIGALLIAVGALLFYKKVYLPKTTYKTVVPSYGDMHTEVFGVGNVSAKHIYAITSQTGGKITDILTDEGKWVKKGDILVHIDPVDLPQQLEEAKIGVKKATMELKASTEELESLEAQKRLALITFKRYDRLHKQHFASKAEYDKTKADLDVVNAQIKATQANINAAKVEIKRLQKSVEGLEEKLARFTVVSPVDGYVIVREAEVAQAVVPSQPILKIVDPKTVWVRTYIDERLSGSIKGEENASIVLRSKPYRTFEGIVKRIEVQSDPVTLEKVVDVGFQTLPHPFSINEQADVTIVTGNLHHVLKLPAAAVVYQQAEPGVWTAESDKAHFVPVKVLARDHKEVAVSGIAEDTTVLLPDPKKKTLKDGMRIHL